MFDSFFYQHDLTNLVKEGSCYKKHKKSKLSWFTFDKQPIKLSKYFVYLYWAFCFHKLVATVFKTTFVKSKPKELFCIDYKHFNHECFETDLKYALKTYVKFNCQVLDKHSLKFSTSMHLWKEVGKSKSGSLCNKSFTQSNYEKIGIRS